VKATRFTVCLNFEMELKSTLCGEENLNSLLLAH